MVDAYSRIFQYWFQNCITHTMATVLPRLRGCFSYESMMHLMDVGLKSVVETLNHRRGSEAKVTSQNTNTLRVKPGQ